MDEQTYPGPGRMVKIDGSRVRRLRESKGLTQLYIATVVGVTTDTISRWENRRYPAIKEENALKLAEALEVSLEEFLDTEDEAVAQTEEPDTPVSGASRTRAKRTILWLLLLIIILLLPFVWYRMQPAAPDTITATRLLPSHIPPGQPFPVIIHVTTKQQSPLSLILREMLPAGSEPLVSAPPFTSFDKKTETLKWISRTTGQVTTFVYMGQRRAQPAGSGGYTSLRFSGSVNLGDKKSPAVSITGSQILPIADYHWADTNRDNRIDDEEILAAYDKFSALDAINYDWQQLDDIWAASGYYWDGAQQKYILRP